MKLDISKHVGNRIKHFRKLNNLTQKELGMKIGVKHNTISGYESGSNEPEQNTLFAIADVFGISINELFPSTTSTGVSNLIMLPREVLPIPILGSIACGEPINAEQNIEGYQYEVLDNIPGGELYYLKARGESMEPTIPNGSLVLIKAQPEVESGQIAAVLLNGDTEATLKRVKWQDNILILMPDNSTHSPIVVTSDNPVRIIGRAIKYTANL